MKLYHGTTFEFSAFELPCEAVNHEYYGKAIYFTSDYDTAKYYGNRMIEIEIDDDVISDIVDAGGKGMKHVADTVTDLVKKGGIIAVNNVTDYNREGAQCKYFDLGESDCGEYKHFIDYRVFISVARKSEANKAAEKINALGVRANISKSIVTGKYDIFVNQRLSDEQAMSLYNAGIRITKCMAHAAPVATTVIFAGDAALELLNSRL